MQEKSEYPFLSYCNCVLSSVQLCRKRARFLFARPAQWMCAHAQYHGQRRIRDVFRLANEFDIVVATYQTVGADHHRARPPYPCHTFLGQSSAHVSLAGWFEYATLIPTKDIL